MLVFTNSYPKAHEEKSPIKSKAQRPIKKTKEQERPKEKHKRNKSLDFHLD